MIINKSKKLNINYYIHIFEPTKACFDILEKKFSGDNNIILNRIGISDKDEEAIVYKDKEESGLASLYNRNLKGYNIRLNNKEVVTLKRLDEYIEEKKLSHIDLFKLDIEGHELYALKGLGKYLDNKFIDLIQFEYGGCNLDSHTSLMELYDIFENSGFIMCKVMPKYLKKCSYSPDMDNFQHSNYVAISEEFFNDRVKTLYL